MTRKVAAAVHLLATTGKTQTEAAEIIGMNVSALSRALAREGVREYLESQKALYCISSASLREKGKQVALRVGIELLENAKSEQVRAKMVEFFAGEARQALVNVSIGAPQEPTTGYRYRRPDNAPSDRASDVEDAQVLDTQAQS
jgi:hypothetical protein